MDNISKQEHDYICFLIAGQTQRQAYRNAFKKSKNWKDKTVDEKASVLFNLDKIKTRYEELLIEAKSKSSRMAMWSREKSFCEFEWLKDKAKEDIEVQGVKKANSEAFLNALYGMNDMAFKDVELVENKLRKEIQYLDTKIQTLTNVDDSESKLNKILDIVEESFKDE